jgi:hypothetical protein
VSSISTGLTGRLPAEVSFEALVTTTPRYFVGGRTHAHHEAFDARSGDGVAVEVVDNVDLAPPVPVAPGDRIAVRGELVKNRTGMPVVHWTHHDPAARHAGGWIDFDGRRYA